MSVGDALVIGMFFGGFVLIVLYWIKMWSTTDYDEYDDCVPMYVNETVEEHVERIQSEIFSEWARARIKFGPFASQHEGFAVLLEEVDELKHQVWTDGGKARMREEAIQVAAMALRFLTDVTDEVESCADDSDSNQVPEADTNIHEAKTLG